MIVIDREACRACGICVQECPLRALTLEDKKVVVSQACSSCGGCSKVCPHEAVTVFKEIEPGVVQCFSCPVQCLVREGFSGACQRYVNEGGYLKRNRPLVVSPLDDYTRPQYRPLITGVGAGTSYPDSKTAPHIVSREVDGVELVTVVTEAPLSYSGIKVKIDTNFFIGEEGARVRRNGKMVGRVTTEEYGSKMLALGGVNLLSGKTGFTVARTIADLANKEKVELTVEKGSRLEIQVGEKPVIDGKQDTRMRIGCGSATIGLFARQLKEIVDDAIILDHHIIGLLSEHPAGSFVGMKYSGITPVGRKSTVGRYFGEAGSGWGDTAVKNPLEAVAKIDMSIARPGMRILVTETTGRKAALLEITPSGSLREIPLTPEVTAFIHTLAENCEESRVSAVYTGGSGGSARAGVTDYPLRLTKSVHRGDVTLTVGGAPVFILPGGGINFLVDVEKVVPRSFTWVPTPATVAPLEYTMTLETYKAIGGRLEYVTPFEEVLKRYKCYRGGVPD
jgi:NAD-dependent dihydropyrimidine dehydrogenase PreA subunit